MRNLLAIFAIIAGVCIAFSDELINKTALTIKTSDPFNSSILMSDIDSITFSNEALDGSIHDSVVTKRIHVSDSVLKFALDSIQYTSFDDVSEYIEIRNNLSNLSEYLTSTNSQGDSYDNVVAKVSSWLSKQAAVRDWSMLDNKLGIKVEYRNGYIGIIYFVYNTQMLRKHGCENEILQRVETSELSKKEYYNVTKKIGEKILLDSNILCFQGCNDGIMSWFIGSATGAKTEIASYQEVLDKSPVNAKIYSNSNLGDLDFLFKELPKSELAIITHTHGEPEKGRFLVSPIDYNLKYLKYLKKINPAMILLYNDAVLDAWYSDVLWVNPELFENHTSKMIGILNYCWSNKFREAISHEQVSLVGYRDEAYVDANITRVRAYLAYMSNGYTHSSAINEINKYSNELFSDGLSFEYDSNCHSRFFSIVNLEPEVRPDYDDCQVKFVIRGWKNLKKDIKGIKIWYKGEPFTQPEEDCKVIEHDFSEYPKNEIDWSKDRYTVRMWPCPNPESYYTFSEGGPDYYVGAALDGLESDSLYYTVGFEYDDGETKNIYHSDVMAIGGITYGVTPGQCIDMGLPSGTKWAAWNMGATNPEEEGGTYGWGEPTGTYTEQPYSNPMAGGYDNFDEVVAHYGGENPASDISGSSYDIAHVKWGNGWRLPTVAQWEELMNGEFTLWQEYTLYGVDGIRVISKINNNKIFFPVKRDLDYMFSSRFWTSELDEMSDNKYSAEGASMSIHSGRISKSAGWSEKRWSLLHVRPVKK